MERRLLKPPIFWTIDGANPTNSGHAIISRGWLKAMKAI